MKKLFFFLCSILILSATYAQEYGMINNSKSPFMKLKSVDLDDCHWTTGFWADKFEVCQKTMIPYMWEILNDTDISPIYENFLIAAGIHEGEFKSFLFHDGDFYKFTEAISYVYSITKDEKLNKLLDEIIEVIAKAQCPDGYLTTGIQIGRGKVQRFHGPEADNEKADKPWKRGADHELYNFGHLQTAACIHYRATGKTNFLDIAIKASDHLYEKFKEPSPELAVLDWNPPHYMGLVEMYRTTGDKKYLELAEIFINMLGTAPPVIEASRGLDHSQRRTPFREEHRAVGHAGHANYMYCGVADVIAETGDKELEAALNKIWESVVYQRMHITGATGAKHREVAESGDLVAEAYGKEYDLPNARTYSETCANIGNAMWNWRMFLMNGDAKYADLVELVLYNSAISGIGLDGKHYFYTNPLRFQADYPDHSRYEGLRLPYLNCFCCPPNIVRTVAKVQNYAYSTSEKGVWVNLYGSNKLETKLQDGSSLKLTQQTDYPWDGQIKITVDGATKTDFSIMLRIPGWVNNATLKINGNTIDSQLHAGRYFEIERNWQEGDVIELDLPMPATLIKAHPFVENANNQIAVKRGPLVYCLESIDLPENVKVTDVVIPQNIALKPRFEKGTLMGVTVLEGEAEIIQKEIWGNELYKPLISHELKSTKIKLIPYYSWSNRGKTDMTVWMGLEY